MDVLAVCTIQEDKKKYKIGSKTHVVGSIGAGVAMWIGILSPPEEADISEN